jgi:hypothetical protein
MRGLASTIESLRPSVPGEKILTLKELAEEFDYHPVCVKRTLVGVHHLPTIRVKHHGTTFFYFEHSKAREFFEKYPRRDDPFRRMYFIRLARKRREEEQRKNQGRVSLVYQEKKVQEYPRQIMPCVFSIDANTAEDFYVKYNAWMASIRATVIDLTLWAIAGHGFVSAYRVEEVICRDLHVRGTIVIDSELQIRSIEDLRLQMEREGDDPMTFYFRTRNRVRD